MTNLRDVFGGDQQSETFLGLPRCDLESPIDADVVIIGAPLATPYRGFGHFAAGAPQALRKAMAYYSPIASHHDFDLGASPLESGRLVDAGDLPTGSDDFALNRKLIRQAVVTVLEAGAAPLVIGGDDSVPIPVFQAFEGRGPLTLLQFDAHLDYRDEVAGERFGLSSNIRRAAEMPVFDRIVQVGMRSMGSARREETEAAQRNGNVIITARQIYRDGIDCIVNAIPAGSRVMVNLDCDSLDSSVMPAVMSPTPGGLGYWDVVESLTRIAAHGALVGFSLTEFMPDRDPDGTCALTAGRIALNAAALMSSVSQR